MKFCFKADVDGILLTLTAERIYRSKQAERYVVSIVNTNYSVVVQSNRPAAEGKKSTAVQWYVVEGDAFDKTKLDDVYRQLEKAVEQQPRSVQATFNFLDHF